MKITKLKKLSNGKYKIELSNGNKITTYDEVILKYNLLYKKEIDMSLIKDLTQDNNYYDNYNKAIKFIGIRFRSTYEITKFLEKKGVSNEHISKIIKKLSKIGLLNDEKFAKAYISDRINLSTSGPNKIRKELLEHKIDPNLIEDNICKIDDDIVRQKLSKQMKKKIDSNHKYSNYMLKQKLFNYFLKLGYDTMMIEETFQSLQKKDNSIIEKEYNKIYNRLSKKYKDNELKMHIKSKLYQKGFDAGEISDLLSRL